MVQAMVEPLDEGEALYLVDGLFAELERDLQELEYREARGLLQGLTEEQTYEIEALITSHYLTLAQGISSIINRVKRLTANVLNAITSKVKAYFQRLIKLLQKVVAKVKEWSISFTASAPPSAEIVITFIP